MTDIEFGELEFQGPDQSIRPDQDAHFAHVKCGDVSASDLPIYVDLDVMRDMEAHARTNTNVELGGVMLGGQFVDDQGNPFVLITDSLRADHYEATKGSFKFTHETWEDITRRRDEFKSDLQMVGWYHTHPDWGVFLSGMDLFICDNFFNRPLDLALVIDPCRDQRGWFQWDDQQPKQTRETSGFYLISNRFRIDELEYFQNLYSGDNIMANDPRYSGGGGSLVQPVVNINDQRTPIQNIAILGMLTIQLMVLALIGYKLLADDNRAQEEELASITNSLGMLGQAEELRARESAYRTVISALTGDSKDSQELADRVLKAEESSATLEQNLRGQMALASSAENQWQQALSANRAAEAKIKDLNEILKNKNTELAALRKPKSPDGEDDPESIPQWMLYVGVGLLTLLGIAGGFWLGGQDFGKANRERSMGNEPADDDHEPRYEDEVE